MSFRVQPELYVRMDAASEANGNSLMAEIKRRLEESFAIEDLYGGPRTAAVLRALADEARVFSGGDDAWPDDVKKCRRIVRAWTRLLTDLLPGLADVPAEITLRLPMTPEAARDAQELMDRYAPPSWWGEPKGFEATDAVAPKAPSPRAQAFTDKVLAEAPPRTTLDPEVTGLADLEVTIELGFGAQDDQPEVCIQVMQLRPRRSPAIVAVRPVPHRLGGGQLSRANWQAASQWIALNEQAIVDHWNGLTDGAELGRQLQRLPPKPEK